MKISNRTKQQWIEKGYEHFALYGPENLSINKISKEIGSPRASFYHHFGDIEVFIEELLDMHWQIIQQFILKGEKECKSYIPDLYILLEQFPIPIQFNKQLFNNRSKPVYNYLYIKTYNESTKIFILKLFSEYFGFKNNQETRDLYMTVGESWYSRLDIDDLSAEKMQQLAEDILKSVLKFVSTELYSKMQKQH